MIGGRYRAVRWGWFSLLVCLLFLFNNLIPGVASSGLTMPPRRTQAPVNDRIAVHAAKRGNPWINLLDGRELPTNYRAPAGLTQVLEKGLTIPTVLASADFDEDGIPDLVCGYLGPSGGIVTLHRGNIDSIFTNSPEAKQRRADGAFVDAPFMPEACAIEVREAPDFLGAGDFDGDGHWDVVAAARGSDALYLLPGDGRGGFQPAERINLTGQVTALVTGEINRADGLTDVVVGVVASDGPQVLVFEGPHGALNSTPEAIPLLRRAAWRSDNWMGATKWIWPLRLATNS